MISLLILLNKHICSATKYGRLIQTKSLQREWYLCRLEPILDRIATDRTIVICPMIDAINDRTLSFSQQGGLAVGGFTWSLHFTWRAVPPREQQHRKTEADPARSHFVFVCVSTAHLLAIDLCKDLLAIDLCKDDKMFRLGTETKLSTATSVYCSNWCAIFYKCGFWKK